MLELIVLGISKNLKSNIIDIFSNGFKCRTTSSNTNGDNDTYIYMAFAEQPFQFSNAR